jgi:hypothetical protein
MIECDRMVSYIVGRPHEQGDAIDVGSIRWLRTRVDLGEFLIELGFPDEISVIPDDIAIYQIMPGAPARRLHAEELRDRFLSDGFRKDMELFANLGCNEHN